MKNTKFVARGSCEKPKKLDRDTISAESYNIVSSSQFFVFVGVMAFLYSFAFEIIYVFFRHKYNNFVFFPLIDFGVTCLFTFFWFVASIAWAKAISDIQYNTNPENIIGSFTTTCTQTGNSKTCSARTYASYANIIVSCVSLSFIL